MNLYRWSELFSMSILAVEVRRLNRISWNSVRAISAFRWKLFLVVLFTCVLLTVHHISRVNLRGDNALNKDSDTIDITFNNSYTISFSFLIINKHVCKTYLPDKNIDLLLLITTVHDRFEFRQTLRSTWLNYTRQNTGYIRYVFLLGETNDLALQGAVFDESKKYKDIIKGDFIDSYRNLTYKTLMGLNWALSFCSNARYVLKTDEDVFIHIPNVLKLIYSKSKYVDNTLAGHCTSTQRPTRDILSRSYVSRDMYAKDMFPLFCSGTGYISSMSLIKKIYNVTNKVTFFPLEDVYIGMCAKELGAEVNDIKGFAYKIQKLNSCFLNTTHIYTVHGVMPKVLRHIWTKPCTRLK